MKNLSRKDLAGMDCDFGASGESAQDVKDKMFSHASESHPDVMKTMSEKDHENIQAKMDSLLA